MMFLPFFLLAVPCANAQLTYFTVIYGNGIPSHVEQVVDEDTSLLLDTLDGSTSPDFAIAQAGEPLPGVRHLGGSDRELVSVGCPNRCYRRASNYCKSLGCSVCPRCGQRRRNLRGLQSDNTTTADVQADAMTIQENLDMELSMYCPVGASNCELWTQVFVVGEDGNITEVLPV